MITDIFDIDEADLLRDVQIEDESGCDIRAGINHGVDLGNYLFQKINAISYDQIIPKQEIDRRDYPND
jgi:hypothetical protein